MDFLILRWCFSGLRMKVSGACFGHYNSAPGGLSPIGWGILVVVADGGIREIRALSSIFPRAFGMLSWLRLSGLGKLVTIL